MEPRTYFEQQLKKATDRSKWYILIAFLIALVSIPLIFWWFMHLATVIHG